jgi:[histone H4]-N-methyl-L-lysine20 N-methyltransferase
MKVQDLARDDDFLSHLLVEKLGTGNIPLLVHKMDPSRRLPKTNPDDLMAIIQRVRPVIHSLTASSSPHRAN